MTKATSKHDRIVARELTIVDEDGNERIRLWASSDGPAEVLVVHPHDEDTYASLAAGNDLASVAAPRVDVYLSDGEGSRNVAVPEAALGAAQFAALTERVYALEVALSMSAAGCLAALKPNVLLGETDCPYCGVAWPADQIKEHMNTKQCRVNEDQMVRSRADRGTLAAELRVDYEGAPMP